MKRRLLLSALGVVAFIAVVSVTGLIVIRTDWFANQVRERIVAEASRAINGRVEIRAFRFDWHTLTAELDDVTIHGTEPGSAAPLLYVKRLVIGLKIISLAQRSFNIARLEADQPRAHLIVQPDGDNNIPPPHTITPQKILDLKVGQFRVADGLALLDVAGQESKTVPVAADARNVAVKAAFDASQYRYRGTVFLGNVKLSLAGYKPLDVQVDGALAMERNRIAASSLTIKTAESTIQLRDAALTGYSAPVLTAKYTAKLALDEIDRAFSLVNFTHSGTVSVEGDARFTSLADYRVAGSFEGKGLGYSKIRNLNASGRFAADPEKIGLAGLLVDALGGIVTADGEVRDFRTFTLKGKMERFDAAALMSLGDLSAPPYDGLLTGPFEATGQVSEADFHKLVITAKTEVSPAPGKTPVRGELDARLESAPPLTISFGTSWLQLPRTRVDFSGVPGQKLDVKVQSTDLAELKHAVALPDDLHAGQPAFSAVFDGTVSGPLNNPSVAGRAQVNDIVYANQTVESAAGEMNASESGVTVRNLTVSSRGLNATLGGSIGLTKWRLTGASAIDATLKIANGDVAKALALADRKDIDLTGAVTTTAQITGTWNDPHVNADVSLVKGEIYGQPYDSIVGRAQYLNGQAQTFNGSLTSGAMRANATARLESRRLTFNVSTNSLALNKIHVLNSKQPDLNGTVQIKANGAIQFGSDIRHFRVLDLNGDINAMGLALGSRNFGDARLNATTQNGILTARINSNAVNAGIQGGGTVGLSGDYPVNASVSFSNLRLASMEAILNPAAPERNESFEGSMAGNVTVRGPASKPDLITANLDISRFELRPVASDPRLQKLILRNDGPVRMTLGNSVIDVQEAHFIAPDTDLRLQGRIALSESSPLNLDLRGSVNLALAESFNRDLTTAGKLDIDATIRGTPANPQFGGRATLDNGSLHYAGFVNGLTNVSSTITFNGTRANVTSFKGETGGGEVDASGYAAYAAGLFSFRLDTHAHGVRVRYPEGVSSLSDGNLTLAGTSNRSEISGNVMLRRVAINPKADAAGILAASAAPLQVPSSEAGNPLANMNLDVQIETAPDVAFETSVAQSLQADANLRLRGTLINPALLGRINISEGELNFFGNRYVIGQGTISFLNPVKIEPILNISLDTKARGVDVILTFTGPIDKLNVSYRSDPPLQFGDIVALLATGRAPNSSGILPVDTSQFEAFQQLGASGLIDQALANSSAQGRLQRFFGVSGIKIDPQQSGLIGSPEAKLSIEQQVTPQILFTYVSDVSSTSTQLIRVEWDFNPRWAAILTREENGYVELGFAWRKRFK